MLISLPQDRFLTKASQSSEQRIKMLGRGFGFLSRTKNHLESDADASNLDLQGPNSADLREHQTVRADACTIRRPSNRTRLEVRLIPQPSNVVDLHSDEADLAGEFRV